MRWICTQSDAPALRTIVSSTDTLRGSRSLAYNVGSGLEAFRFFSRRMAARWVVLFPGAAHASRHSSPTSRFSIYAGKHDALSCKIIRPSRYARVLDKSVAGGRASKSGTCLSIWISLSAFEKLSLHKISSRNSTAL